jgi:hypothetical protein
MRKEGVHFPRGESALAYKNIDLNKEFVEPALEAIMARPVGTPLLTPDSSMSSFGPP